MASEHRGFSEQDWKLFRKRIGDWQERYMQQLNEDYIKLLEKEGYASEKFWELEKRIRKDKKSPGVIIHMSRSDLIDNVLNLLFEKVINMEDLEEFSDLFKETIRSFVESYKWDM